MHIANESYFSHVLQIAIWLSKQYCSQVFYTIIAWKGLKKKKKREKSDSADSSLITSDTNKSIESKMHGVENSFSVKLRWTFVYYFTDRFRLTLNYHMLDHKRMSAAPRNNRVTPTRSYFSFDLWKWFVDKCAWINIIFVCFSSLFKWIYLKFWWKYLTKLKRK